MNNCKSQFFCIHEVGVTRTCCARYTFVLHALHVRVPPVTRTCNGKFLMAFWNMFLYIKSKPPIHFCYLVSEVCCYICRPTCQPILLIFFSFSSSISFIFLPSMIISFSEAKFESVRIAFEVVMFDRFARSSRER